MLPAILSGLIAAAVSWYGVKFNMRQRSVIEARQRWRDQLRTLVPKLTSASTESERLRLRDELVLYLNPYKDELLLEAIDNYLDEQSEGHREVLIAKFSEYLKYDWERAKAEAGYKSGRADRVAIKKIAAMSSKAAERGSSEHDELAQ